MSKPQTKLTFMECVACLAWIILMLCIIGGFIGAMWVAFCNEQDENYIYLKENDYIQEQPK